MVYELVTLFTARCVLNKCLKGKSGREVLFRKGINVLTRIPFDKELGLLNSNAEIAVRKVKIQNHIYIIAGYSQKGGAS